METAPRHRCLPLGARLGSLISCLGCWHSLSTSKTCSLFQNNGFPTSQQLYKKGGGEILGHKRALFGVFSPRRGAALLLPYGLFSSPSLGPPGLHKQLCLEKSSALFKNTVVFQCCASPEDVAGRQLRRKSSFQNRRRRRAAGRKLRF